MKSKKTQKSKSTHLALYFILLILFIFLLSFVFKVFDTIGKSKFDGGNRFTSAIINANGIDYVSVSPKEGTLTKVNIDGAGEDDLGRIPIPYDGLAITNSATFGNPKTYFIKMIFGKKTKRSNLTIIDLIRLSIYTGGVSDGKIINKSVSAKSEEELSRVGDTDFADPEIAKEKVSIQITNGTQVSGLGNNLAKYLTNLGANVVLVNTSVKQEKTSKILFSRESYTVNKLSKILGLPKEKNKDTGVSDIDIIIGEDRESFF